MSFFEKNPNISNLLGLRSERAKKFQSKFFMYE